MLSNKDEIFGDLSKVYDEIQAYYAELEGESARAAAILAMAGVEDELECVLRRQFPEMSDQKWKRLAGPGNAPLSTMEARMIAAEAFGLFGPKTRATINRLARIRNKFAHRTDIRSFKHPDILKTCRELADNPINRHQYKDTPEEHELREKVVSQEMV